MTSFSFNSHKRIIIPLLQYMPQGDILYRITVKDFEI